MLYEVITIQAVTPDGLASDDPKDWNDGVRFNDFGTIEKVPRSGCDDMLKWPGRHCRL